MARDWLSLTSYNPQQFLFHHPSCFFTGNGEEDHLEVEGSVSCDIRLLKLLRVLYFYARLSNSSIRALPLDAIINAKQLLGLASLREHSFA